MNEGLIPSRYARALYKVDLERRSAAHTYELMKSLSAAFAANGGLRDMVTNPFVDPADKTRIVATAAGATADDTTFGDFLTLLVDKRRIDMVQQMALAYLDIYRKANNIKRVEVVSAAPLADDVLDRIRRIVAGELGGASMEFTTSVDSSLIGGFIVNIDNERLDASMRNRLKELRLSLLN